MATNLPALPPAVQYAQPRHHHHPSHHQLHSSGAGPARSALHSSSSTHRAPSRQLPKTAEPAPAAAPADVALEPPCVDDSVRRSICLELLVAGHLESYTELYQVTDANPSLAENEEQLRLVQKHLAAAEMAERAGDVKAAFQSRRLLAESFQSSGDVHVSQHFWNTCLDSSQRLGDGQSIADTYRAMADKAFQEGKLEDASAAFHNMYKIAKERGLEALFRQACGHCAKVHVAIASRDISVGAYEPARERLKSALGLAQEGEHADIVAEVYYHTGLADEALKDVQLAVEHMEKFMSYPRKPRDLMHTACLVLGRCHEALGDMEMAAQYLGRLADVSSESGDHVACAGACARLANMFSLAANHRDAVEWFTRALDAARKSGDLALAASVRAQFGIARSRALLPEYMKCLGSPSLDNMVRLLSWKDARVDSFTAGGIITNMAANAPPHASDKQGSSSTNSSVGDGSGSSDSGSGGGWGTQAPLNVVAKTITILEEEEEEEEGEEGASGEGAAGAEEDGVTRAEAADGRRSAGGAAGGEGLPLAARRSSGAHPEGGGGGGAGEGAPEDEQQQQQQDGGLAPHAAGLSERRLSVPNSPVAEDRDALAAHHHT